MATILEAFERAQLEHDCAECLNAHVGKTELCHCHEGHWQDRTLAQVRRVWRACPDFEEAGDE